MILTSNSKIILILWSGGLDSTYLVYSALKEGHQVRAYYCDLQNNSEKTKVELEAIEKLRALFDQQFPNQLSFDVVATVSITGCGMRLMAFHQLCVWIPAIWWALDTQIDEVQLGYVCNDDAISYLPEIVSLYSGIAPFINGFNEQLPPLTFPLIKYKKTWLKEWLPCEYFKLTVWCESPSGEGTPCGNCSPCRRRKNELNENFRPKKTFSFLERAGWIKNRIQVHDPNVKEAVHIAEEIG